MNETLHGYYGRQEVFPTYGGFASEESLAAHERARRRLFTDKLALPRRTFAGARLLELGPDAGENALVFALWGADCTLAEPNARAHSVIREYFERFSLQDRLVALEKWDLEGYPEPAEFDIVDAEGFIHTIQPASRWTSKLTRLLREEGFAVLFYHEAFGSLFELVWKVVHARFRALTGAEPVEAARAVFAAKWESIPHKRPIESWTMDVLESPFVRLRYFLEADALCTEMAAAGCRLYSSWPRYDGGLDVHWFKSEYPPEVERERRSDFIARSRLSHFFGRKHFLGQREPGLERELWELLELVDGLVDEFADAAARDVAARLSRVAALLESDHVIAEPEDTTRSLASVAAVCRLLEMLVRGRPDEISSFCNTDQAFIATWGMPAHFAVFQRRTG